MENPALIEQISSLVKKDGEKEAEEKVTSEPSESQVKEEPASRPTSAEAGLNGKGEKRTRLLGAIKPYLSSERQKALDTMITLSDIMSAVRR